MTTEELWYPEFGLRDDPFQYNDFNAEYYFSAEIPRIRTEEVNRIKILKPSCFIVGNKGDGKSTVAWMTAMDLSDDPFVFSITAPPSLTSFYVVLYDKLHDFYRKNKAEEHLFDIIVKKYWFEIKTKREGDREWLDRIDCHYPYCNLRRRCQIRLKEVSTSLSLALGEEQLYLVLLQIEKYCPLKVYYVQKMIEFLQDTKEGRYKFILDAPDDLYKGINDFKDTVRRMQKVGSAIILSTHEQCEKLQKSDFFGRFVKFEFKQMTNEDLKALYYARVKWLQRKEGKYPPLVTDDALEFIIKKSIRNPRYMLMICEEVLANMKNQKKISPVDVEFIEKTSETVKLFNLDDYVLMLVKRYKDKRKRWIKVKDSVTDMMELFNVEVNGYTLGRKLASLHHKGIIPAHRCNPDSEYLYHMGTTDKEDKG